MVWPLWWSSKRWLPGRSVRRKVRTAIQESRDQFLWKLALKKSQGVTGELLPFWGQILNDPRTAPPPVSPLKVVTHIHIAVQGIKPPAHKPLAVPTISKPCCAIPQFLPVVVHPSVIRNRKAFQGADLMQKKKKKRSWISFAAAVTFYI